MRRVVALALGILFSASWPVLAQEKNSPIIIPERLQKLAADYPIAFRLGINWESGVKGQDDVGRYLGLLAAVNEVAISIARKNERSEPKDEDYIAAMAALCIWPPNKPPLAEKYWSAIFPAFYDQAVRAALDKAVGPIATQLPYYVDKFSSDPSAFEKLLPTNEDEYMTQVINLKDAFGGK